MTSLDRRASLLGAVDHLVRHRIAGDIVECGVWRGGSMMLAALALMARGDTSRDLWLYDTFEGMSEPTAADREPVAARAPRRSWRARRAATGVWCEAGLADVQANLWSTGYPERAHPLRPGQGRGHDPGDAAGADRPAAARHRLVRVDPARARPPLSAAGASRRPRDRRLRPLAGRAPGGRRVLRGACRAGLPAPRRLHRAPGRQARRRMKASVTPAVPPPRLLTALPQVYAAAAVRLVLPLVVLPIVAGAPRRRRVRPARLHPRLGRPAGDAGRRRLPRRGDAARGRRRRGRALAPWRSRCSRRAWRSRCRRCCWRSPRWHGRAPGRRRIRSPMRSPSPRSPAPSAGRRPGTCRRRSSSTAGRGSRSSSTRR